MIFANASLDVLSVAPNSMRVAAKQLCENVEHVNAVGCEALGQTDTGTAKDSTIFVHADGYLRQLVRVEWLIAADAMTAEPSSCFAAAPIRFRLMR